MHERKTHKTAKEIRAAIAGQRVNGRIIQKTRNPSSSQQDYTVLSLDGNVLRHCSFRELKSLVGTRVATGIKWREEGRLQALEWFTASESGRSSLVQGQVHGSLVYRKKYWHSAGKSEFEAYTLNGDLLRTYSYAELSKRVGKARAAEIRAIENSRCKALQELIDERDAAKITGELASSSQSSRSSSLKPLASLELRLSKHDLSATVQDDIIRMVSAYHRLGKSVQLRRLFDLALTERSKEGVGSSTSSSSATNLIAIISMLSPEVTLQQVDEAIDLLVLGLELDSRLAESEKAADLLEVAHLFVFDDDAFAIASEFTAPLEKLPYSVCLVEDVLLRQEGSNVTSKALVKGASTETAIHCMSFVVNRCVRTKSSKSEIAYISNDELASKRKRSSQHTRRGHWRNQACGPGMKDHKRIWISATLVNAAKKPYRFTDSSRIHRVRLSKSLGSGFITSVD
ncbi:MAG: hypothetical protein J6D54_09940 [Olsenella sp.]|nr:hypothetical protein [Olsenella sp.]